jgi:hypothetical protein
MGGANSSIQQFPDDMTRKRQNITPNKNKDLTSYFFFMLYFVTIITVLV